MTENERESTDDEERTNDGELQADEESNADGLDRRAVLKGTAAAGFAGTGLAGNASATTWKEIRFCAAGNATFSYRVDVTGQFKRGGKYESDEWDSVGAHYADGAVSQKRCDSYLFTGDIANLNLDGPGKVLVNGNVVKDTTKPAKNLPNTVTIKSKGGRVAYQFQVSGQVAKAPEAGTLGVDVVEGNKVRGKVGGKIQGNPDPVDVYRYSGAIAFNDASGPLQVTLDINP